MIKVESIKYSYGQDVIRYPDFEIEDKSNFVILGNSGSGKTTLLHLMSGLLKMQEGVITIDDVELAKLRQDEMDHFRGKNVGLVFQKAHLINSLTVKGNLLAAQYFSGVSPQKQRVLEALTELDLVERQNAKPHELSQGEAQRVAIARAVLNRPKVILADEPTSSLDDENCFKVLKVLMNEAENYKASLVVVTHDQRVKEQISEGINLGKP